MYPSNFGWSFGRMGLVLASVATFGLSLTAPSASAQDDQSQRDQSVQDQRNVHSESLDEVRVAQLGPVGQRGSLPARTHTRDARYYYVQPRDIFGNPGPLYRLLGIAKSKKKRPLVDRQKLRAAGLLRRAPPAPPTKGPLLLTVSLAKQQLTLYDQGVAVATSPISTGTPNFPTPTGVFSVIQKQWWHRSNLYSSAPMPFMQRLTWSGIALHAGILPGYPASHGCIRLPDNFAIRLWGTTRVGVRTIITHNEVRPVAFAHPRLFAPRPTPKPDSSDRPVAHLPTLDDREVPTLEPLARQGQLAIESVPVIASTLDRAAAAEGMTFLAGLGTTLTLVSPDGLPIAEGVDVLAADSNDDDDHFVVERTSRHTISIVRPDRPNEVVEMTRPSQIRTNRPNDVFEVAEAPQIREDGVASIMVVRGGRFAEIEVIEIAQVAPAPQLALHASPISAPQLVQAASVPEIAPPKSDEVVSVASIGAVFAANKRRERRLQGQPPSAPYVRPLRLGPVSVFVSRKEQRLFVRKGFEPLFDMPVTIVNPERRLGNHVFTAISMNDMETRWTVVSLPDERVKSTYRKADDRRSRKRHRLLHRELVSAPPPASPREALDRIDMPTEAITRISELLTAGATLIVSDEGLGHETGRGTDFTVVQTK